jgi:hypothetical protein
VITGGNADLSSACPQRGPPPTLTTTVSLLILALW